MSKTSSNYPKSEKMFQSQTFFHTRLWRGFPCWSGLTTCHIQLQTNDPSGAHSPAHLGRTPLETQRVKLPLARREGWQGCSLSPSPGLGAAIPAAKKWPHDIRWGGRPPFHTQFQDGLRPNHQIPPYFFPHGSWSVGDWPKEGSLDFHWLQWIWVVGPWPFELQVACVHLQAENSPWVGHLPSAFEVRPVAKLWPQALNMHLGKF